MSPNPTHPRETKRSKGIAYVLFQIPEDAVKAQEALDMTTFQVRGGPGVCELQSYRAPQGGGGKLRRLLPLGGGGKLRRLLSLGEVTN